MDDNKTATLPTDAQSSAAPSVAPPAATSSSDGAVSAPVVEAPKETQTVEAPNAEGAAEQPVAQSYLGADAPKDVDKPADTAEKKDEKPADAKADEAKPADAEPKKEEASQSVEPAPLPSYEPFTLPEGSDFALDEAKVGEFMKELGELQNLTKAEQKVMQEFGQKMFDRHVAELQETTKRINEYYLNAFEKQKADWKDSFEKDPEIGGNRRDTTVNEALQFIRTHGGTPEQQEEFRNLMDITGVGNHPAMIRMLAQASRAMSEGKPLPASKPVAATAQSKIAKRYGSNT